MDVLQFLAQLADELPEEGESLVDGKLEFRLFVLYEFPGHLSECQEKVGVQVRGPGEVRLTFVMACK